MNYYQLQTISCFSFGESSVKLDEYASYLKEYGYTGGGVGDISSISSFPYLYSSFKKKGLKDIYGELITIENDSNLYLGQLIILNEEGYLELIELFNKNKETYNLEDFNSIKNLALILKSEDEKFKDEDFLNNSLDFFKSLNSIFDLYFGIEIYSQEDMENISVLRKFVKDNKFKSLSFPKVQYLNYSSSYKAYLILNEINKGKEEMHHFTINEFLNSKNKGPFFLLGIKALEKIYLQEEIISVSSLVEKINFNFMKKRGGILQVSSSPSSDLKKKVLLGLALRTNRENDPKYLERINYELNIINSMDFSSYFLIVDEYVNYCKSHNIKVGPGRGSSCGSLVSYCLNITDIDPIKYNLSFERFLNPLRKTMPDIDVDFEDTKRGEVINHLIDTYGKDRVGLIVTYNTLQMKAALKEMAEVFDIPSNYIDNISKSIPFKAKSFEDAKKLSSKFASLTREGYYKNIIDIASLIISYPVTTSIHASGVLISDSNLTKYLPVQGSTTNIVLYEYETLENMGFLKFDILALSNLSFIKKIETNIINNRKELPDIYSSLNDRKVYQTLNELKVKNVFQLESFGIQEAIREVKPTCLDDLSAILALYRPGPMNNIKVYASRKNERRPYSLPYKGLEDILKDTYGIIIYQEQILEIATKVGNFSKGEADLFRRAISKKDLEKMLPMKDKFLQGCKANNLSEEEAINIFNLIEKFAEYGFNKSHSYAYSFITYTLLYYKTYFPEEFYLASLEGVSLGDEKMRELISEMYSFSFTITNPSLNLSKDSFVFNQGKFVIPFNQIRGLSNTFINLILEEREKGEFDSIYDFFLRIDCREYKREVLMLVDAGVFDSFISRKTIKNNIDNFINSYTIGDKDMLVYVDNQKEEKDLDYYLSELTVLNSVFSMRLVSLLRNETKYSSIYIVREVISYSNNSFRLVLANDLGMRTYYLDGQNSLVKNDIISIVSERRGKYFYIIKYNKEN